MKETPQPAALLVNRIRGLLLIFIFGLLAREVTLGGRFSRNLIRQAIDGLLVLDFENYPALALLVKSNFGQETESAGILIHHYKLLECVFSSTPIY